LNGLVTDIKNGIPGT